VTENTAPVGDQGTGGTTPVTDQTVPSDQTQVQQLDETTPQAGTLPEGDPSQAESSDPVNASPVDEDPEDADDDDDDDEETHIDRTETVTDSSGNVVETITVTEDIVRRGQVALSAGDKVHAHSAAEMGISPDGKDLGEQANAAHAVPILPSAGAQSWPHPDAVAEAQRVQQLNAQASVQASEIGEGSGA
jgi:hypothetical protein